MEKSAEAFRTISEVSDLLETPAHVLRFWESRFSQIRPVKRAGGRRYYRPADIALLTGIKRLLHDEGLTIRGVQKVLREQGVRFVSDLPSQPGMVQHLRGRGDTDDGPDTPFPDTPFQADEALPDQDEAAEDMPADGADMADAEGRTVVALAAEPAAGAARSEQPLAAQSVAAAAADAATPPDGHASRPVARAAPEDPAPARVAAPSEGTGAPSDPPVAAAAPIAPADADRGPGPAEALPLWAAVERAEPAAQMAEAAADEPWLPAQLRAITSAQRARHLPEILALEHRLALLHERMGKAAERPRA